MKITISRVHKDPLLRYRVESVSGPYLIDFTTTLWGARRRANEWIKYGGDKPPPARRLDRVVEERGE